MAFATSIAQSIALSGALSSSGSPGRAFRVKYFIDSVGGSDANSGETSASPKQTWTAALALTLNPGELVAFKEGSSYTTGAVVNPWSSGTPGKWVGMTSYPGNGVRPIFDANGANTWMALTSTGHFWMENLNIVNFEVEGIAWDERVYLKNLLGDGTLGTDVGQQFLQAAGGESDIVDCEGFNCNDEVLSIKNVSQTVRVNGGHFRDSGMGINGVTSTLYKLHVRNLLVTGCEDACITVANEKSLYEDCVFRGTSTGSFGAVVVDANAASGGGVNRCVFDYAGTNLVAQMLYAPFGRVDADRCTFYGGASGHGRIYANTTHTLSVKNSIIRNIFRAGEASVGTLNLDYCNSSGVANDNSDTNTNAIAGNPLLTDPDNDVFTLGEGSPCIGAGENGVDVGAIYAT